MQQTFGLKRLVATHVAATVVALGVLVSSGLAMAGLTATGTLPWTSGGSAQVGAQQQEVQSMHTDQEARLFEAKLAQQDALGLQTSMAVARAVQQARAQQFYTHKEEQLLALSSPPTDPAARQLTMERNDYYAWRQQEALDRAATPQWLASPHHIGFMGLRYVSVAATTGLGTHPTDRGSQP